MENNLTPIYSRELFEGSFGKIKLILNEKKNNEKSNFDNMANGVFNIFDENSNNLNNAVILLQTVPYYKLNCLEMASEADCQKFIALPSVQNLLTEIWIGKIEFKDGIKNNLKVT